MYLSTCTRPNISFTVNNCAKYISNPNKSYIKAL